MIAFGDRFLVIFCKSDFLLILDSEEYEMSRCGCDRSKALKEKREE